MKLSVAKSRIVGLRVGMIEMDLINGGPPLAVRYVLLREDGSSVGMVSKGLDPSNPWSEKALKARDAFIEAIEEEALPMVFEIEESINKPVSTGLGAEGVDQY